MIQVLIHFFGVSGNRRSIEHWIEKYFQPGIVKMGTSRAAHEAVEVEPREIAADTDSSTSTKAWEHLKADFEAARQGNGESPNRLRMENLRSPGAIGGGRGIASPT